VIDCETLLMRMIFSLCFFFFFATPVLAGETQEYSLGDLTISYDPARWSFARVSEGNPLLARPDAFVARCIDCRNEAAFVAISVGDIAREESEAALDPMWTRDRRHSTMTIGELTFGVTTIHSPCRNYVPPSTTARVAYKGKTYSFRTGAIMGCRGSGGVDGHRFDELLRGLHPRD
jgi:hypothetical protein